MPVFKCWYDTKLLLCMIYSLWDLIEDIRENVSLSEGLAVNYNCCLSDLLPDTVNLRAIANLLQIIMVTIELLDFSYTSLVLDPLLVISGILPATGYS